MDAEFIITLDIDWAPDFVIDEVAEILLSAGVRATWFVTHASPAIDRLRECGDIFELGVHPNFLPGSSHGDSPDEVLRYVLAIVPDAISFRPHGVVQSGRLTHLIATQTRLRVDSSYFLPEMPHIAPVNYRCAGRPMIRVPFFWADDYALEQPDVNWRFEQFIATKGLKVLLFHPIHVYMNASSSRQYQLLKRAVPKLQCATRASRAFHAHTGSGTASFFRECVKYLGDHGSSRCLRDVEAEFLELVGHC